VSGSGERFELATRFNLSKLFQATSVDRQAGQLDSIFIGNPAPGQPITPSCRTLSASNGTTRTSAFLEPTSWWKQVRLKGDAKFCQLRKESGEARFNIRRPSAAGGSKM